MLGRNLCLKSPRRQPSTSIRFAAASLLAVVGAPAFGQTQQTFAFDDAITFGDIGRVGDPDRWEYDLGFDWDQDFSIGTIVGKKDAVIIPEVTAFGATIIPEVTADTRTGARFSGNIAGDTGLVFYADYDASGLESGTQFSFAPTIDLPNEVRSGEFVSLTTSSGLIAGQSFNTSAIDLPSFEAGMDFYFNLALQSKFEAGLFPFGYTSTNFNPDPINVDQSLLKFEFDLDPDSNPNSAAGTVPTFTMFEDLPFEYQSEFLDDSASVLNKQISVDIGVKDQPGVTQRLDIGEVQIVNPFGADTSVLGGTETNLKLNTDVTDSTIQYTAESALLRLGLDLDGIAAYLGTGQSFTRLDESEDGLYSIVGDFIDLKYGPEIGYRETVDINPELAVTLTFGETVALKDGSGLSLGNTWSGNWDDLPEIALLGLNDVEVEVDFQSVTGEQTKRGAFYLTDYLEFTLLELEELTLLDEFELSLPPVYRGRTSLLGALLGEFELEVVNDTEAIESFNIDAAEIGDTSFTLFAAPTELVFLERYRPPSQSINLPNQGEWTRLSDGNSPSSLVGTTLYFGYDPDDRSPNNSVVDLASVNVTDIGGVVEAGGITVSADAMVLPTNSSLTTSGDRIWDVNRVVNDGLISSDNTDYLQFGDFNGAVLQIVGDGTIASVGAEISFQAPIVLHGPGHTLFFQDHQEIWNFDSGPLHFVGEFINAGQVVYIRSGENTTAQITNEATGVILASGARSLVEYANGDITNRGLMIAENNAEMRLGANTPTNELRAPGGTGGFEARTGGKIVFKGATELGDRANTDPTQASSFSFEVRENSEIDFEGYIFQANGTGQERTSFIVEEGGTLRFNGIQFPDVPEVNNQVELPPSAYSDFIEIHNAGTIIAESGRTFLFFDPDRQTSAPGVPNPPIRPEVTPLNLTNTGEIIVQNNAVFGFEVEITDYSDGDGATLNEGTWTVVGNSGTFSNLTDPQPYLDDSTPSSNVALLDISVVSVASSDTYLSQAGFSDTNGDGQINDLDGFPLGNFDTDLAVNNATVTLSGRALFPYFNTVKENRGTLNLQNGQQFTTAGDLLNTGTLNVESDAGLIVSGDLIVDEGTINIASGATLDVGSNTIEVIGGTIIRDFATPGTANVNTAWIVREKWVGEDANGDDIILPGFVDYTGITFPVIGTNADITLDGEQARFVPIEAVNTVEGKLRLLNGNHLTLNQLGPSNTLTITETGLVEVVDGARLDVAGGITLSGELFVDADSYLELNGVISFAPVGGVNPTLRIDGVVNPSAGPLSVTSSNTTITGEGQLVSTLLMETGTFSPGNSPGTFEILGNLLLDERVQTVIEVLGDEVGVDSDLIKVTDIGSTGPQGEPLSGSARLGGDLVVTFGNEVTPFTGQRWDILQADNGISRGEFDFVITTLDPTLDIVNPIPVSLGSATPIGSYDGTWNIYLGYESDKVYLIAAADLALPLVLGDTNNDGVGNSQDFISLVQAVRDQSGYEKARGLYPLPAADLVNDGVLNDADLRAAGNSLPIFGTSSIVIRSTNFISLDQAFDELDDGLVNGSQVNLFGTELATGKAYQVGDSRGDIAGLAGPDGAIDAMDIDVIFDLLGSGVAGDMDGDLDTDADDIADLVQNILGTNFGDANLDGEIDDSDLFIILNGFGSTASWAGGDFNGDGLSDILDLNTALRNFTASESALFDVPEPGSLAVLGTMLFGLTLRRRRSA